MVAVFVRTVSQPNINQPNRWCFRNAGNRRAWLVRLLVLPLALSCSGAVFAASVDESDSERLQVADTVSLGTRAFYRDENPDGLDVVIDLRYPYEGVYEDMGSLKIRGIRVLNIPVSSKGPTLENVVSLEAALAEAAGQRVLIHDSDGHRTATLWGAYRIRQGDSVDAVVEALRPLYDSADFRQKLERFRLEAAVAETDQ